MTIQILFFATLKDAAQTSQLALEVPENATIADLQHELIAQFPKLERLLPHTRIAVNQEYAKPDFILKEGDEVALIPPVSGGQSEPFVQVRAEKLSLDEVVDAVRAEMGDRAGAICTFLGVVRSTSTDLDGQSHDDIEFLDYEAYAPMAEREMRRIALECRQRFGAACAITHRTGRLGLGEASVAIAVAAAHRGEAFEACRFAIETLKKEVPVWKRETARDGFWWSEGS